MFKELFNEDHEDVTTKQDIFNIIDSLSDELGEENVDYDEIMEILLNYMESEYDLDDLDDLDDENIKENKWFDDDLGKMKKSKKNDLVTKKLIAKKAKRYYKLHKKKLLKKQKKYRKKVKSGKIKPRTHDRIKRKK